MAIEVVKGVASAVRFTIDVRGNRDGVSTKHHTIFKVGDTTVMFTSGSPPIIGDGDQLIVAGRKRGKMLVAEAYVNRTAMIRGNSGLWQNLIGAALALPMGAIGISIALLGLDVLQQRLFVLAVGLFFTVMGLVLLYRWATIRRAVKLVRDS